MRKPKSGHITAYFQDGPLRGRTHDLPIVNGDEIPEVSMSTEHGEVPYVIATFRADGVIVYTAKKLADRLGIRRKKEDDPPPAPPRRHTPQIQRQSDLTRTVDVPAAVFSAEN